ncbi:NYN domain-containing protein [Candidatus Pacearchaeota archaeon]|nr:NYN domain-containing protein [Candidatus Pacearchaeota archaeon]
MSDVSEKCAIFIDRGYLGEITKTQFNNPTIDYLKLCDNICSDLKLNRLRTYVYTCLPIVKNNNPKDIERKARVQKFLSKLKRLPRFEIKLGKLQIIGNQFKQKMIDVLMSLDIATMSYENQIQHAIIIAGDSDFIPAIKKAKDYGIITHLYYHPSSVHNEILDEVDELHEITQELIDKCKIESSQNLNKQIN